MKMEFERHPGDPCPVFTIRYQLLFPASRPPRFRHRAHRALRNFAAELYVYGIRNLSTGGGGVVRAREDVRAPYDFHRDRLIKRTGGRTYGIGNEGNANFSHRIIPVIVRSKLGQ